MAMSRQETPYNKFSNSGQISPRKKSRSNSLSTDLDGEHKLLNNESIVSQSTEKLDFHELRKKFEPSRTSDRPQSSVAIKRPASQAPLSPTPQTNTSSLPPSSSSSPKLNNFSTTTATEITQTTITTTRATFAKPQPLPKPKSASPPSSATDTSNSVIQKTLRISMNNVLNNGTKSLIEEQATASSPLPDSTSFSVISEDDNQDRSKSVQKICEFFDKQHNPHVYLLTQPKHQVEPIRKSSSPGLIQNSRQPPPRPAPRPEKFLKSQLSGWHSIPSFDPTDSTTGDSSLSSNQNLSQCESLDDSFSDEEADYETERKTKLRRCVEEVHATEKTYVNILYVLSVKISAEIKTTCDKDDNLILLFNSTYKPLLGTIQQIYKLHHDLILPKIEEYITEHRTGSMWTVLEENFKFIEVLYKNYYVTYYETQGKLDELCKNHPLINEAMLKCQVHLGNLYPITQLNCANQRLLRYILCMKTYMKYLNADSAEYKHTRSIHDELDRIAVRCEEELVISSAQLNELKERLENKFECIKDHRKLLWHGTLKKQSPRRHADIAQRYMILFSDCILLCNEESGRKLDINRELSMRGITVDMIQGGRTSLAPNSDQQTTNITYYPFRVNAVEKSYEFLAEKESDREIWVKKIRQASDNYNKRITLIEIRQSGRHSDEQQLGDRAPAWISDHDVTRCQNCNNRFRITSISSRRHHCRSCGRCICGSCSTKKLILEYCKTDGEVRICDTCYTHFTGTILSKNMSIWPKPTREIDQTILFGDFRTVNSGGVVWIALQEDYHLHIYGAKLDQAEDYSIRLPDLLELQLEKETRTFTLRETTKTHVFAIETNHQISYQKNDSSDDKMKTLEMRLLFYTDLWYEAMQLARSTTLPIWYIRKRDSSDSGVSNVG